MQKVDRQAPPLEATDALLDLLQRKQFVTCGNYRILSKLISLRNVITAVVDSMIVGF